MIATKSCLKQCSIFKGKSIPLIKKKSTIRHSIALVLMTINA